MAAINDIIKKAIPTAAKQQVNNLNLGTVPAPAGRPNSHYTGLAGVSGETQQQLGKYTQGYTPSQSVTQAQEYLNSVVTGKPGAYQNNYRQQLDDLYNQVMNRPKFSYDLGSDMLYQQYKDQYMNLGQQAMMDTTAQASAMTGGYGNSYAATAGNQAYQAYLQQLNNIVPDLYQMAMNRYQQEGEDLNNRYALTADLEGRDYSRYQDDYNRWLNEREYANSDYWNRYNADYGQYGDERNFWATMAGQENSQYNADRELAYNQAMAILSKGKMPSDDLLAMAGISSADAKKLRSKASSGGGGGRSSGSGGSGGSSGSGGENTGGLSEYGYAVYKDLKSEIAEDKNNMGKSLATEALNAYLNNGFISETEKREIASRLGI